MFQRTYRAVCFDLDGTLLMQDIDDFMSRHYKALSAFVAEIGIPADAFKNAMIAGTGAATFHEEGLTNEDTFWEAFLRAMQETAGHTFFTREGWIQKFLEFYSGDFDEVGKDVVPNRHMVQAVAELRAKGYPLLLTTMPLFPLQAVERRLAWAGLEPSSFQRITTFGNSTASKPSLRYWAENLAAMGLPGEDVLTVGNNTVEDVAFTRLGVDIYLVTDFLLDPAKLDMSTVKHGSAQDFYEWVCALPVCEDPAQEVLTEVVPVELTADAYYKNLVVAENAHADYVPVGMDLLERPEKKNVRDVSS